MAASTLGKRTRLVVELGTDVSPSKKTKPSSFFDLNDENHNPLEVDEDCEEPDLEDTPTKRRRTSSISQPSKKPAPVTPSTPRHRDALSNWPTTPRHAVMSAGKLFKRMTPHSVASPSSPSTIQTVYHSARQLFARGSEPGQLVGREAEREQLVKFLSRCSTPAPSGCLYVSGPPGTGKSAMISQTIQEHAGQDGVRSAYINCMSIKSSKDLYNTLLSELGLESELSEANAVSALRDTFCSPKEGERTAYLVTLDEIDHILTMGLESLYRLFEWSLQKPSQLVLVGIANALDLTDRLLPRLKSKNLRPELLSFLPYTAAQVKSIITTRLKSLMPEDGKEGYVPFIHPAAIELCSRKVSSQTGDLRKAFEICRRALDLIEAETKSKHEDEAREKLLLMTPSKRPLGENTNGAKSAPRSLIQTMTGSLNALTAETAPRASISHLNKVTAAAFSNGTTQRLKALNLQQRAALCALVAYETRSRAAAKVANGTPITPSKSQTLAPTIKNLFDAYCRLCVRDSVLHPLSSSEFREVVSSLETLGLVNEVDGKSGSFGAPRTPSKLSPTKRGRRGPQSSGDGKRIASCVGEKEIQSVAEGVGAGILGSILSGEALD